MSRLWNYRKVSFWLKADSLLWHQNIVLGRLLWLLTIYSNVSVCFGWTSPHLGIALCIFNCCVALPSRKKNAICCASQRLCGINRIPARNEVDYVNLCWPSLTIYQSKFHSLVFPKLIFPHQSDFPLPWVMRSFTQHIMEIHDVLCSNLPIWWRRHFRQKWSKQENRKYKIYSNDLPKKVHEISLFFCVLPICLYKVTTDYLDTRQHGS